MTGWWEFGGGWRVRRAWKSEFMGVVVFEISRGGRVRGVVACCWLGDDSGRQVDD